jgi:adenylate cyclase
LAREKFCGDCGVSLIPLPKAEPPQTVAFPGEKKHITVLFADVAGSMDLQEQLDAEVWAQIMGRFVAILATGVRKYGGTVDKFTGDGIMALFGAPVAQEDHARRACHAAWQLNRMIGEYAEELRRERGIRLHVRMGLNSGEVVVGRVGQDVTLDPTALGHTVGLAQRMEAMADPGSTYLTEYTARLVEGWFQLTSLGPRAVKGAREPRRVFMLGGPGGAPRTGGATPLVGRTRELVFLEDALASAVEGRAQVVGVVGEAGVGKSRLCDEFTRLVSRRGITVRRASGVSHGKDVPLLPILALLRDYFSISVTDSPAQARDKVSARLVELDPNLATDLPLLFDFLEVPDPERPVAQLVAEARMRRVFDVLRRLTARRSERETLVLLVEDLHWFDPQSEAFLERLVESYPGTRTLVLTNFRPEFAASWMRHSYYRQLSLAPLAGDAVGELVSGLLGVDLSLVPLLEFVAEHTGGNPFFVEEVIRALIEDGTLGGSAASWRLTRPLNQVKVPPSVQAVLAARIDRLPAEHKDLLQIAAVVGRSFPQAILAAVTDKDGDELDDGLRALCAAELLQQTQLEPFVEYRFWHPLTQEVAYSSLLGDRRASIHGAVAEALAERDTGRLDELAGVLARHWERAGQRLEAARWSVRAGAFALRSDLGEALRRWQTATDLLDGVEETPASMELAVRSRIHLVRFGARVGMEPAELRRLEAEAKVLAGRLGDPGASGLVWFAAGAATLFAGDARGGVSRWRECTRLGEAIESPDMKAVLLSPVAYALAFAGPLSEAVTAADRALMACAGNPERGLSVLGSSPLIRSHYFRGLALARMGRLHEANTDLEQAVTLARAHSESEMLSTALSGRVLVIWLSGEQADTTTLATEAIQVAEDTGNTVALIFALEALAKAHLAVARPADAVAACERALTAARGQRTALHAESSLLAQLASSHLACGNRAPARQAANEAVSVARRQGTSVLECLALLTRAQIASADPTTEDRGHTDLTAALELATGETGALAYEPYIREARGRLCNNEDEIREALRLYGRIGATGHARRLESELSTRPTG